jgi:hypothetical protein
MMTNPRTLLIAALLGAAMTSASTARAADPKKKQFFDMLNASVSTATNSSQGAAAISQSSFTPRASSASSGIQAATARGNLTLAQYRRLVYRELVQNRNNLFAALRLYQRELRSGQISRATYLASRANALLIWQGYSAGLKSEFTSGTPYYFTTKIGLGPGAIVPGPLVVHITPQGINSNPQVVPPLTTIR